MNSTKLVALLKPLQKLELLDVRGRHSNSGFFDDYTSVFGIVKPICAICIFADNGLHLRLAAELHRELPKCRVRIANCKNWLNFCLAIVFLE